MDDDPPTLTIAAENSEQEVRKQRAIDQLEWPKARAKPKPKQKPQATAPTSKPAPPPNKSPAEPMTTVEAMRRGVKELRER